MSTERTTIDAGGKVSVLDHGGSGPLIVCVHGLEGSAYNWDLIAPDLVDRYRVVAPDLSGFGYTEPLDDDTTVERNARLVADVIDYYGGEALLIGNSMGALVSMLTARLHPEKVTGLVLIDPAAPVASWLSIDLGAAARLSVPLIPLAGKRLINAYRRTVAVEDGVRQALEFVAADASRLDDSVWQNATEIAALRRAQPWSTDALISATHSIAPYVLRRKRFSKLIHSVTQPTLIVHGTNDAVVRASSASWIAEQRPDWTVAFFQGLGHVPMLEDPSRFLAVFNSWASSISVPR